LELRCSGDFRQRTAFQKGGGPLFIQRSPVVDVGNLWSPSAQNTPAGFLFARR
jgi:hypothetical protein